MANPSKKTRTIQEDGPHPMDVHVGARLRLRRNLLGWSQDQLGKAIDLTFQQIQKYERGTNRMGASRIYDMSKALNVPASWFFEGFSEETVGASRRHGFSEGTKQAPMEGAPGTQGEILSRRETAELLRAWYSITDVKQRKKLLDVIKSMSEAE